MSGFVTDTRIPKIYKLRKGSLLERRSFQLLWKSHHPLWTGV